MENKNAAIVEDNVVTGLIVIEPCEIPTFKEAMGYERLISVNDHVLVGDTYDPERSVFFRDGKRIYPEKTDSERITELETQISEIQDALIEVADIITMSDSGEDGGTDG